MDQEAGEKDVPYRDGRLGDGDRGGAGGGRGGDVAYLGEREEDALDVLLSVMRVATIQLNSRRSTHGKNLAPEEAPHLGRAADHLRLVDGIKFGFEGEHARRNKVAQISREHANKLRRRRALRRRYDM